MEKEQKKSKGAWSKVWHFIWHEDSVLSWIVNIILAFILIKFIVYPGLGFVLGTGYPVVAVVSGSMEHDGSFDDWWSSDNCGRDKLSVEGPTQEERYTEYKISKADFMNFPYENGFNTGDIMVLQNPKKVRIGDIIVFQIAEQADPIIHRVVEVKESEGKYFYTTKGDHNCGSAPFEKDITEEQVLGKALQRIPWLGWIKIIFVGIINLLRV